MKSNKLKWLSLLFVMMLSTVGAMAQTNQELTQIVCPGPQPYSVTPGNTSNTFLWSISPGISGIDWTIESNTSSNTNIIWANPTTSTSFKITFKEFVISTSCFEEVFVDVTLNPQPLAPGVASVLYCLNQHALPLTATGTGLLWYTAATGGTGSATAPIPSTTVFGNTSYWVSQANTNSCEGPRAEIVVTVNDLPLMPGVTPVLYCLNQPALPLTAIGTGLLWYTAATGGIGSATAPIPSTSVFGNTSYWVSQANTNSCEGPRAEIVVTVNDLPLMPGVAPVLYCLNQTALPLTATGTGLLWYTAATGGTGSAIVPTPSTLLDGNTSYWVSQANTNSCEGPRGEIIVTVNQLPATSRIFHN